MSDTLSKSFQPLEIKIASDLVGIPYLNNGIDLNGFDCWGLVWYFYNELGIKTPKPTDILTEKTNKKKKKSWKPIDYPKETCLASFKRNEITMHVGIYIPTLRKLLHADKNMGVICEDLKSAQTNRGMKAQFYKWH